MSNSVTFTINHADTARIIANVMVAIERGDAITITPAGSKAEPTGKPFVGVTNGRRVEIPHGTPLMKVYYDTPIFATIDDGKIIWDGRAFDNLTAAAYASGLAINPKCNAPNGYEWWKVKEDEKWVRVAHSKFTEPKKK